MGDCILPCNNYGFAYDDSEGLSTHSAKKLPFSTTYCCLTPPLQKTLCMPAYMKLQLSTHWTLAVLIAWVCLYSFSLYCLRKLRTPKFILEWKHKLTYNGHSRSRFRVNGKPATYYLYKNVGLTSNASEDNDRKNWKLPLRTGHCHLTPPLQLTSANIRILRINLILPETRVLCLHFRHR